MAKKSSTLKIKVGSFCLYKSNVHWSVLFISKENLLVSKLCTIIPPEITKLHTSYIIRSWINPDSFTDELFDRIFHVIAYVIEVVLENEEKESLLINQFLNEHHHERLVRKIKDKFEHRENFHKIKIQEFMDLS